jgi:hypothetical protein
VARRSPAFRAATHRFVPTKLAPHSYAHVLNDAVTMRAGEGKLHVGLALQF